MNKQRRLDLPKIRTFIQFVSIPGTITCIEAIKVAPSVAGEIVAMVTAMLLMPVIMLAYDNIAKFVHFDAQKSIKAIKIKLPDSPDEEPEIQSVVETNDDKLFSEPEDFYLPMIMAVMFVTLQSGASEISRLIGWILGGTCVLLSIVAIIAGLIYAKKLEKIIYVAAKDYFDRIKDHLDF